MQVELVSIVPLTEVRGWRVFGKLLPSRIL